MVDQTLNDKAVLGSAANNDYLYLVNNTGLIEGRIAVSTIRGGIDTVLALTQQLSANRTIDSNGNEFEINGIGLKKVFSEDGLGEEAEVDVDSAVGVTVSATDGSDMAVFTVAGDGSVTLGSTTALYILGDGAGANLPGLNSDSGNEIVSIDSNGNIGRFNANAFRVLTGAGAPTDGTTVAWYDGQIYIDTTNKDIYYASVKSTDPDSSGAGSAFVPIVVQPRRLSSLPISVNTTTTPSDKINDSFDDMPAGNYVIHFETNQSYDDTREDMIIEIEIDSVLQGTSDEAYQLEPKDSGGDDGDGRGTSQKNVFGQGYEYTVASTGDSIPVRFALSLEIMS